MKWIRFLVLSACALAAWFAPLASALTQPSASPPWFVKVTPGVNLPVGDDTSFFTLGGGSRLEMGYRFPQLPWLRLVGHAGYDLLPVTFATSLSLLSFGLGTDLTLSLTPRFDISGFLSGGYYFGFLNSGAGPKSANPYIQPGIGISFALSPSFRLGVEGAYRNYLGLYGGFGVAASATLYLGGRRASAGVETLTPKPLKEGERGDLLQIKDAAFVEIFPVFFKYYEDHPVGKAIIRNNAKQPLEDISISLFIKQYMDNPKGCVAPVELKPGEEKPIELNALLTEKVLEVTESTKASAEITISYRLGAEKHIERYVETVRIYDRNAISWDDDRKAAAFVTEKDPTVLRFSKNVASVVEETANRQINANLQTGMAIHIALAQYGLNYAEDPSTPYKEFSKKKMEVDFLQFPNQTLGYRAGDCDDLSILYCALLQSRGIETAFITIPGHIFVAFALGLKPEEARARFVRADEFIFTDEETWLPVEITEIQGGFLKAWQTGMKEWREYEAKKQAVLYPVREAWAVYEPTGFSGERGEIALPPHDKIAAAFRQELESFISRQIYSSVAELTEEIAKSSNSPKAINKLGLLYAAYGLFDRAEREFGRIVERTEYVPALLNLGNLSYLRKEMKKALEFYRRANMREPDNPKILLALARASHSVENFADSKEFYARLKEVDPDLAIRFTYLDLKGDEATRAGAVGRLKEEVLWEE